MSNPKDGGPAFPLPGTYGCTKDGMSLRDYFAGKALAGLSAQFGSELAPPAFAAFAYKLADAMLAAREAST